MLGTSGCLIESMERQKKLEAKAKLIKNCCAWIER
jgi:hypothetical protein